MSRPIRFRAWHEGQKKWLHDSKPPLGGVNILGETIWAFGEWCRVPIEELNDVVVEQFTGVLDRDGQEIYEGDIIEWSYFGQHEPETQAVPAMVVYSDIYASFILFTKSLIFLHKAWRPKVVGNVHENRNLMRP